MVSSIINVSLLFSLMLTFFASLPILSNAVDTLRPGHSMQDGKTLISAGEIFELGFFSPGSSKNRYVGIWYYNFSTDTVLWVGNRENPVPDTSGALAIGDDGNLVVLDGTKSIIWSSNVSLISNRSLVQLLDTGNLVVNNSGNVAWQSFDHPTDTYLPGMKVGLDLDTNVNQLFTSWRSKDDPGVGNFSVGMDPRRSTQIFLWEGTKPRWRSGPWNGQVFIGVENMMPTYIYGFKLNNFEQEHKMYFYYNAFNSSHRYVLTSGGTEEHLEWKDDTKNWTQLWAQPITDCELYNKCGNYASCTNGDTPICSCLKGFVPVSEEEWDVGIWSSGCTRRTPLQCETNASTAKADADGFWKLQGLKLPDLSAWDSNDVDQNTCQKNCIRNCSCKAYAFVTGIGCLIWDVDLVDVHVFSNGGNDLYLRLAASELGETKKVPAIIILIIVLPVILIVGCIYLLWKSMSRINGFIKSWKTQGVGLVDFSGGREGGKCPDLEDSKELPQLSFDFIAATTGNFSPENFLGMGGFGPVYKGMFPGGQEIAVKRLSRSSGQGMEEFKNEVIVIAKLQHRNLVRLLGYSIQDEEKLLIYEYMPNRSLDAFLFDSTKKLLLNWKTRHNIIDGIARGLLYLHRDSRLRIIHRDLKVSNILLDEEMNPKISDFGMARIFRSDDEESNTRRVVGTYGYMSPEYAMNGLFSVKSDVYSFGVLLLEIVSGQKNSTYHHPELSLNLLSYAWKLWNEDNVIEFVDPSIRDTCSQSEVWRCVCMGLLCVQHSATDRPTMSSVVIMLESETTIQLLPKQPTFSMERSSSETDSSTADLNRANSNASSIPMPTGR